MSLFKIRLLKEIISLIFLFDGTFHIFGNDNIGIVMLVKFKIFK